MIEKPVSWEKLEFGGCRAVSKVAATFQVGPPLPDLPFASFKVKVIERIPGEYVAVPNVARLAADGSPHWISGLGDSVDEALADCLKCLQESFDGIMRQESDGFCWANLHDF